MSKFRFTLTHQGSESVQFAIPAFSLWDTQVGSYYEWTEGANPFVTLPGVTPLGDFSEYLYVNYGFVSGVQYTITLNYTKVYNSGNSNPRTIRLHVLDNSYASQFSEVVATPVTPGGDGSVTLSFTATSSCTKIAVKVADGSNVTITLDSISGTSVDPNDITTTQEISEPDGWTEAILKLERHPEYRSLLEYFDGGFIFYGNNGVVNGGIEYIKNLEQIYGPDVSIEMLIEYSEDDYTYEDIFEGQLDLSMAEELVDNKIRIPIIRDNFWAVFNSRKDTPVSLTSATDLDGNAVAEPVDNINFNLVPQVILEDCDFENIVGIDYFDTLGIGNVAVNTYVQFDWDQESISEIKTKYNYPGGVSTDLIPEMFAVEFGGSYTFDIKVCFTCKDYPIGGPDILFTSMGSRLSVNIQINGDAPILFTVTEKSETYLSDTIEWTEYTYQATLNLNRGDLLYIYGYTIDNFTNSIFQTEHIVFLGNQRNSAPEIDFTGFSFSSFPFTSQIESYMLVTANTTFPDTVSQGFLIHDAAAAILKSYGLGETNPFYSDLFGSNYTNARQYTIDGCAWQYGLIKGLQLRQYSLDQKPFSISFDQWWKGANPIFCLGLTYDEVGVTPDNPEVQAMDEWFSATTPEFAKSTIELEFVNWDSGDPTGTTIDFTANVVGKNEVAVISRSTSGEFTVAGSNEAAAINYEFAWETDYAFGLATTSVLGNLVIIDAINYNVIFAGFSESPAGRINETISNGPNVASWDYISFTYPSVTVQSDGGVTEYSCGSFLTQGQGTYMVSVEIDIDGTIGANPLNLTVIWALLDDSFNEIETHTTIYGDSDYGINIENITFNPVDDGFYLGVRIINNTVTDDKTVYVNLAQAAESTPGQTVSKVIRVEQLDYFYDPIPSFNISNIRDITRKYDNEKIYNKINVGYNIWKSEGANSIDDPQTQHIYSTLFKKIGQTITLWSDYIAAAIAIELARRSSIDRSTDYKHDESVFIIALNPDDVSPDAYMPELDENFASIENLNNPTSRYNIRLSPARNFLRWRKWLNGCLQQATNSFYKFVRGEGNFDMVTDMASGSPDCLDESYDNMPLSEKQDIEVTTDYIHLPNYYEINVPLEWEDYKTIRDNRTKAVGISLTDINHVPMFIDKLEYAIMKGSAKISGWTTEYFDISVIEDTAATQNCNTEVYPTTEVNYRLLEDGFVRLTESGDRRILQ